ncbi:hypothetical protein [Nonomuraea sp. NPDC050691]|uniref:hypothetical protein n=1 Tax=Nonomuraea sp. NPDC050691 TaxID=3155661 RepID=UPI0033E77496
MPEPVAGTPPGAPPAEEAEGGAPGTAARLPGRGSWSRARTAELLDGMELLPRRNLVHRGARFVELDADALIARRPHVVLIDEPAHTNAPGSRNAKRRQDVDEILDAGIDVVSTVDIRHLESLSDVVEQITGIAQGETCPTRWCAAPATSSWRTCRAPRNRRI